MGHLKVVMWKKKIVVMWLEKFIRSTDNLKKVHPKEYNLTFEISGRTIQ